MFSIDAITNMASIKSIAADIGLSPTTVSLVLNGRGDEFSINKDTEELIKNHAKAVGYSARTNRKARRSMLIAGSRDFALHDQRFLMDVVDPLLEELEHNNWQITLAPPLKDGAILSDTLFARNDAILITPHSTQIERAKEVIKQAAQNSLIPVVLGRDFDDIPALYVDADHYAAGRLAASYLLEQGRRNIAMVEGITGDRHTIERSRGFCDQMADAGKTLPPQSIWPGGNFWITDAHDVVLSHLHGNTTPDAIYFQSDMMALGGYYALRELNLSVPEDVCLIGHGDELRTQNLNDCITSIRVNAGDSGLRLAKTLMTTVQQRESITFTGHRTLCEPQLILRNL